LTISNGASVSINTNNLTLADNFTLGGGASLNAGTWQIIVGADWTNNGGSLTGTSTVKFTDASKISHISGSTSFFNFTCTTAGKQLTFAAGSTQTINGTLTLTGAVGNRILLRSSVAAAQWKIDPNTTNVSYVDVRDSNNINATMIIARKSKDSDNNLNWYFVDYFTITGAGFQLSGAVNPLTVRAVDGDEMVSTSFDGDKQLTFDGAGSFFSFGPTVTDKNGISVGFGKTTTITFTDGVSTAGGKMVLYLSGISYITLNDGIMNTDKPLVVEVNPVDWVYEPYVQKSTINQYTMIKVNEVFLEDNFWRMANFTVTIYLDKSLMGEQGFDKKLLYEESARQKKCSFPSRYLLK
jgi:hypothetical protein